MEKQSLEVQDGPLAAGRRPIRVVLTKVGLDGHDRGVKVIAQALRDAGMEVIYAGLRRTPEDIAPAFARLAPKPLGATALVLLEEDADVLGLSILSGAVVPLTRRVMQALRDQDVEDVVLVVGGIVPDPAREELVQAGVTGVFTPGSSLSQIIEFIERSVRLDRQYGGRP